MIRRYRGKLNQICKQGKTVNKEKCECDYFVVAENPAAMHFFAVVTSRISYIRLSNLHGNQKTTARILDLSLSIHESDACTLRSEK